MNHFRYWMAVAGTVFLALFFIFFAFYSFFRVSLDGGNGFIFLSGVIHLISFFRWKIFSFYISSGWYFLFLFFSVGAFFPMIDGGDDWDIFFKTRVLLWSVCALVLLGLAHVCLAEARRLKKGQGSMRNGLLLPGG